MVATTMNEKFTIPIIHTDLPGARRRIIEETRSPWLPLTKRKTKR